MDNNGLYDIYGMVHVPWWQRSELRLIALLGILLMLLVIVGFVLWRFMMKKKVKTPWDHALESLNDAYKAVFKDQQQVAFFYSTVTVVLKKYFDAIFDFDLVGRTDAEWLVFLQTADKFPKELLPLMAELLEHAGTIKFARGNAMLESVEVDYNRAVYIIQYTIPKEIKKINEGL